MREQFRDVSPEDTDLQPIIEGLFGEYAARYGDYFSKERVQPAAVRRSAAFHQDADPRSAQQNRIRSDDEQR